MGTANYDASRITQRKRAVTMYSWNADNKAAINSGKSVRREQPGAQLGEFVTYRNITQGYTNPSTVSGGCACSDEVTNNTSGGNANNVQ